MSVTLGHLYHWSPRSRLGGIRREGLQPGKRNVSGRTAHASDEWIPSVPGTPRPTGEFRQPAVCLSPSPAVAWAYSHGVWGTLGTFDLWEVRLVDTDDVEVLRQWGAQVNEVRVHNRIPKRRLVWVGERTIS